MTTKEYLEQIENIDIKIKALAMQERRLRNKQGDEKSLQELINNLRSESIELQKKITTEIYSMKDNRYSTLLTEKYLNGATWEQIAASLGYNSVKYVRKVLFPRALAEFEKNL